MIWMAVAENTMAAMAWQAGIWKEVKVCSQK